MSSVRLLPRVISPASVQEGDTIRVNWTVEDVKRTIEGVVASREYQGSVRVFSTDKGVELLRWHPELKSSAIVFLINQNGARKDSPMLDIFTANGRL